MRKGISHGAWPAFLLMLCLCGCRICDRCGRGKPVDDEARAGHPTELSCLAKPSDTGRYIPYQVGGGCARKVGDAPCPDEGTWGWDYAGFCFPSRIILGWWHGRRHQDGAGDYRTDGPRPIQAIERRHEE